MGTFTITHEINCDVESFWKLFFDKDFNTTLFKQVMGFPKFEIQEQKETPSGLTRKVFGEPKMDMPGPVKKLMGDKFSYTEEGTFDRAKNTWTFKMITPQGDKVRNEGTMKIEAAGAGKVRRVATITLEAKIFMIGGMIESTGEKQLREGWDKSASFMNQWIKDGKAPK